MLSFLPSLSILTASLVGSTSNIFLILPLDFIFPLQMPYSKLSSILALAASHLVSLLPPSLSSNQIFSIGKLKQFNQMIQLPYQEQNPNTVPVGSDCFLPLLLHHLPPFFCFSHYPSVLFSSNALFLDLFMLCPFTSLRSRLKCHLTREVFSPH